MADEMTFWDHLDELRKVVVRVLVLVLAVGIVAFFFKEALFSLLLAPTKSDFVLFRWIGRLASLFHRPPLTLEDCPVSLISTQLTSQFVIHMSAALMTGVVLCTPYIVYQVFRFVSPALYADERLYARQTLVWAFLLFFAGVVLNYLLIFPLSFRFLATYQVSTEVANTFTLQSYMQTLFVLSLLMGLMFELPVLCRLFARLGFLTADFMRKYRRHAIIVILLVAAIITPTGDVFTLSLVSLPILLLYELSIGVVARTEVAS